MRIQPIGNGVWGVDGEARIPGATLPARMTILRTEQGLVLVSPLPIDDALASEIAALGEVVGIVGPNAFHHLHLESAMARYPEARLVLAEALAQKRPELPQQGVLEKCPWPELEPRSVDGAPKLGEVVLLHRPSATLVTTDLVFNIPSASGMTWWVLTLLSRALGRVEQSRLWRWYVDDRAAAGKSVESILELPFERVVVAHGDIVDERAAEELAAGLWWMRGERRRPEVVVAPA